MLNYQRVLAGKSTFMVQYLEPLCRHVTNVCSMGYWATLVEWLCLVYRVFLVDRGMAGSAYPIRVGPSVFKLVVPIDYPTPRNPGEIAGVSPFSHHFPIIFPSFRAPKKSSPNATRSPAQATHIPDAGKQEEVLRRAPKPWRSTINGMPGWGYIGYNQHMGTPQY